MASQEVLKRLLDFLDEDLGSGDVTTSSVLSGREVIEAEVIAKEGGVLSGLEEAKLLLMHFGVEYSSRLRDGDALNPGTSILTMRGNAARIIELERLMLNVMMRMSGIATATKRLVDVCNGYGVTVAATRKTTPGFRLFEKKAVTHGGGATHRMGLYDAILIKDNHVAVVGLEESVWRAKKANPEKRIEVEVSSAEEAVRACKTGTNALLLDNLSPADAAGVIENLRKARLRDKVLVEISGGVTPDNVEGYAKLKPDVISSGYITTNAKWLDMSLKVKPNR